MKKAFLLFPALLLLLFILQSCSEKKNDPSAALIDEVHLKKGALIFCGPAEKQFGSLDFEISATGKVKEDFNLAVKLLHSFEYDEAEKAFAKIVEEQPSCAMAYWGVAMANFHPLWTPPSEAELKKGSKAVEIAATLTASPRESAYINAIGSFYKEWEKADHRTRCLRFERAMENIYTTYPTDKEGAIFYALALDAAADPTDKSFSRQKKAGNILKGLYPANPNHPGIAHYLIHTYDYPGLAEQGLEAARKYASVAPSSAHALHMPSHIFTRLGLWDECIQSNLVSVASAKCYAEAAGIQGHWDEELHGLDYLVYAYLQKGENDAAMKQWQYLQTIRAVSPANFKVAYAFAAIPSRYLLENRIWKEAASLQVAPAGFSWQNFPWQEAIVHFTRLMGLVHTADLNKAKDELAILNRIHDTLSNQKDNYKAGQVAIQVKTGKAWIQLEEGKRKDALLLMQMAADMEDKTEKHPVTPCEVLPARELLGDMLLQTAQPAKALQAYGEDLQKHPNRFNALYGAGLAAQKSGDMQKAIFFYTQLLHIAGKSNRAEITKARQLLIKTHTPPSPR